MPSIASTLYGEPHTPARQQPEGLGEWLAKPRPKPTVTADVATVRRAVAAYLQRGEPLMLDTETTGLDPRHNRLVMVQLRQPSSATTLIVDWRHLREQGTEREMQAALRPALKQLLVVGHNLKFDAQFLLAQNLRLSRVFDTMLAEQLCAGDTDYDMKLAAVLNRHLGLEMSKLERKWFYDPAPLDERTPEWLAPFPREEVDYAALDVDVLPDLHKLQRRRVRQLGVQQVCDIEMAALPAFAVMEYRGVLVNQEGWRAFIAQQQVVARESTDEALAIFGPHILAARIRSYDEALEAWEQAKQGLKDYEEELRNEWHTRISPSQNYTSWGEFKKVMVAHWRIDNPVPAKPKLDVSPPNIGSQDQLIVGMKALDIPVPTKRNQKGETKETTETLALERMVGDYPELRPVMRARKANKYVDAFGEKLLAFADDQGRIHPDYMQIGADTGRTSCSRPNWQQIPSRGEGAQLRKCVVAAPGNKLIVADFSNIELRIIADLSGDENLLAMFASGEDMHSYTARLMFKLGPEVDPKTAQWRGGLTYRAAAKAVNYLIPYGGSAGTISARNNLPQKDSEELLQTWYGMFGGVQGWMETLKQQVRQTCESRTLSGRFRTYQPPMELGRDASRERRQEYRKQWATIERQARNTPVQGLSADITKLAMGLLYERLDLRYGCLVAVVHDEMVVEAPEQHAELAAGILAQCMDEACKRFLTKVALPYPEPTISDHWTHD